jgi:hypothetical protein
MYVHIYTEVEVWLARKISSCDHHRFTLQLYTSTLHSADQSRNCVFSEIFLQAATTARSFTLTGPTRSTDVKKNLSRYVMPGFTWASTSVRADIGRSDTAFHQKEKWQAQHRRILAVQRWRFWTSGGGARRRRAAATNTFDHARRPARSSRAATRRHERYRDARSWWRGRRRAPGPTTRPMAWKTETDARTPPAARVAIRDHATWRMMSTVRQFVHAFLTAFDLIHPCYKNSIGIIFAHTWMHSEVKLWPRS